MENMQLMTPDGVIPTPDELSVFQAIGCSRVTTPKLRL